jgi:hypothetical protein
VSVCFQPYCRRAETAGAGWGQQHERQDDEWGCAHRGLQRTGGEDCATVPLFHEVVAADGLAAAFNLPEGPCSGPIKYLPFSVFGDPDDLGCHAADDAMV